MYLEEAHSPYCPASNLLNQRTVSAMRGKSFVRERVVAYANAVMRILPGFGQLVSV